MGSEISTSSLVGFTTVLLVVMAILINFYFDLIIFTIDIVIIGANKVYKYGSKRKNPN